MKRCIPILLVCALFATVITGCSNSGEGSELPHIGVAIYKYGDTFMKGVRKSIKTNAEGRAKVEIVDSQNSQLTQNDKVDMFIMNKTKALLINPVDRTGAGINIEKAKTADIPVVFLNREPLADDMKKWDKVYYVGAKAEESGTMSGEIIADYWKSHPEADKNKDGVLQYVMLKGEPGHQDAELRTKYSIEAIEAAGIKVEKVAEDSAYWDRVKGQEKMATFLELKGGNIEAVLANNDDMALGAIDALKDAGYFKGDKYMPVVGVDAMDPAIEALEEGTMLGTVLNDANTQGKAALLLATLLANGEIPTKEKVGFDITDNQYVWIQYKKITKENIDEAK
ncbi:galactose ABC transporter substrate-binding protein [Paenibacillus glacialis]|uniref:D-galactose/methyl-galactoside binding periplasmic protein MglB n=1 Tax=Paenibacillus glacialis TaxID=494026 RepID=A0A162K8L5_9BACL|nr:galactose ABC transporter substrate-binding protein [Paenibacillus glacialis]OAB44596.1 methyl-galactoside ABC transporter substrate-binding protein [Paenibacillus glacialis]